MNQEYEEVVQAFVADVLVNREFTADLAAFVMPLVAPGRVNSLAPLLLKLTAPGVPDLYQGTEIWELSLVDPDNRRPVDYGLRRQRPPSRAPGAPGGWRVRGDDGALLAPEIPTL